MYQSYTSIIRLCHYVIICDYVKYYYLFYYYYDVFFFDIITIIIIVAYSCYMCSVYCHNYFLLLSLSMVVIVICTPFVFILAAGATPGVVQWRDFPSPGTAG